MKAITTKVIIEATAELKNAVEEELEIEDPTFEEAEAILKPKKE